MVKDTKFRLNLAKTTTNLTHEGVPKESQFLSFGTSLYQGAFPNSGGFCNLPVSNTNIYHANHLRDNI